MDQRVSLHVDDLLLYVSDPSVSIPAVLSILGSFGTISGYKLNLNKSDLFQISQHTNILFITFLLELLLTVLPF